jgi:hypothetical protein
MSDELLDELNSPIKHPQQLGDRLKCLITKKDLILV